MKGADKVKTAWTLFRVVLKESLKVRYCFWFLMWFVSWSCIMGLCSVHPLIVGFAVWLPTTLLVLKLADVWKRWRSVSFSIQ